MKPSRPTRPLVLLLLFLVHGLPLAAGQRTDVGVGVTTRPHLPRQGPNLMPNPSVEGWCPPAPALETQDCPPGPTTWHTDGSAQHDAEVTRSVGSGSMTLPSECEASVMTCAVKSPLIPVETGKVYTAAAYLKSDHWPPPTVKFFYIPYNAQRKFITTADHPDGGQRGGSRHVPAHGGGWGEAVEFFTVDGHFPDISREIGVAFIRLKFVIMEQPEGCDPADPTDPEGCERGQVWVDDAYFGEGVGFAEPPPVKTAFSGDRVRVDSLGNMEIQTDGHWRPFFPIMIYPTNNAGQIRECCVNAGRECTADDFEWQKYARYGFNTVNQVNSYEHSITEEKVGKALQAELMFSFSLDGYVVNRELRIYNDTRHLDETFELLAGLRADPDETALDRVIMYNWDAEKNIEAWGVAKNVTDRLRRDSADRLLSAPEAPIYALYLNRGLAGLHTGGRDRLVDAVGGYVKEGDKSTGSAMGMPENLLVLDRLQGQPSPVLIAQVNPFETTSRGDLRTRVYKGLILGARGLSIYADCRPRARVPLPLIEDADWRPEVAPLANEIDRLLPILREPHSTEWTVDVEPGSTLAWGTREHGELGYAILANMSATESASAVLRPTGLGDDRLVEVHDFFSGTEVPVVDGSFALSLAPYATAVYQLAFVLDADGDGVADDDDNCLASDSSPTIVIDECDSGVANMLREDGCTIADLTDSCIQAASDHGQFVSCVSHLTNEWRKEGLLSGRDRSAIVQCAARANLP